MEKKKVTRWQASGLHLLISVAVAAAVFALMLSLWYPEALRALRRAHGPGAGEVLDPGAGAPAGAAGGEDPRRMAGAIGNQGRRGPLRAPARAARLGGGAHRRKDRTAGEDADHREDLNPVIVAAWPRLKSPTCASTIRTWTPIRTTRRCVSSR